MGRGSWAGDPGGRRGAGSFDVEWTAVDKQPAKEEGKELGGGWEGTEHMFTPLPHVLIRRLDEPASPPNPSSYACRPWSRALSCRWTTSRPRRPPWASGWCGRRPWTRRTWVSGAPEGEHWGKPCRDARDFRGCAEGCGDDSFIHGPSWMRDVHVGTPNLCYVQILPSAQPTTSPCLRRCTRRRSGPWSRSGSGTRRRRLRQRRRQNSSKRLHHHRRRAEARASRRGAVNRACVMGVRVVLGYSWG